MPNVAQFQKTDFASMYDIQGVVRAHSITNLKKTSGFQNSNQMFMTQKSTNNFGILPVKIKNRVSPLRPNSGANYEIRD